MAVEMAIWRMTDAGSHQLASSPLDFEQRLEDMLTEDPSMSGTDLLIIGRQVQTSHGGYIDLLALDADGRTHVLELKRDRTPRDVVAQALDYGSWVQGTQAVDRGTGSRCGTSRRESACSHMWAEPATSASAESPAR